MTLLPLFGLVLAATGCAGSVFPPALPERAVGAPIVLPEARAENAVERIASDCADGVGCVMYLKYDIHPPVEVPSSIRYFVTSQPQEVRSVGFQLRFDWGGRELEVERGNTLAYNFDQDP